MNKILRDYTIFWFLIAAYVAGAGTFTYFALVAYNLMACLAVAAINFCLAKAIAAFFGLSMGEFLFAEKDVRMRKAMASGRFQPERPQQGDRQEADA